MKLKTMWLLKFSGLALIFSCASLYGHLRARGLERRVQLLSEVISGLSCLREQIRCDGGELRSILPACFSNVAAVETDNLGVKVLPSGLFREDIKILEDLFSALGSADSDAECSRIDRGLNLLERQRSAAFEESRQKGKLWRSGGVCMGAAICILLV